MAVQQYSVVENDWINLTSIINDLTQRVVGQELHPTSTPTFADLTLTGDLDITGDVDITGDLDVGGTVTFDDLTASRIVATNASKELVSLASPLIVSEGGTGAATLTDGGVLLGSGTGAITAMAVLADGEFIVGDGTTDPVAESGDTARTSLGLGTGDSPTFSKVIAITGGIQTQKAANDVSSPPTDSELDTAFGTPSTVGAGFIGVLDDADGGTDCYLCWTTGTDAEWFYIEGTKAVAPSEIVTGNPMPWLFWFTYTV